jgi:hypothetical protein
MNWARDQMMSRELVGFGPAGAGCVGWTGLGWSVCRVAARSSDERELLGARVYRSGEAALLEIFRGSLAIAQRALDNGLVENSWETVGDCYGGPEGPWCTPSAVRRRLYWTRSLGEETRFVCRSVCVVAAAGTQRGPRPDDGLAPHRAFDGKRAAACVSSGCPGVNAALTRRGSHSRDESWEAQSIELSRRRCSGEGAPDVSRVRCGDLLGWDARASQSGPEERIAVAAAADGAEHLA